jgi:hypothetical protein
LHTYSQNDLSGRYYKEFHRIFVLLNNLTGLIKYCGCWFNHCVRMQNRECAKTNDSAPYGVRKTLFKKNFLDKSQKYADLA